MRCDKCNQNDATIFLTQIVDGNTTKVALCATCGAPFVKELTSSPEVIEHLRGAGFPASSLADRFARAAATNLRYTKEAFWFVREAVDRASKGQSPPTRHVPAKELLEAL